MSGSPRAYWQPLDACADPLHYEALLAADAAAELARRRVALRPAARVLEELQLFL
ncbi:hypothetical protein [Mumia zhuanghuii]|uniref:hypothetical protein n=1 Tax=Mumia zhuanghuii TaxID=2585211 RepID=UPI00129CDC34|nr:hypothetical protein [Mumia zhuanghuii]